MQFSVIAAALFASLAAAIPQSGGSFVSVGNKYGAGGCADSSLIFADPIFGNGNACQALSRQAGAVPIFSYKTLSSSQGCTVKLFTDANCATTGFNAPVGGCVQGPSAFQSVFVTCV